jgi:hypothetical protein
VGYLIDILVGVVSAIVTGELRAHVKPFARWIIERAVRRLSLADRERFREEWLAHLEETPGILRKIWHVFGCYLCAAKLSKIRARYSERIVRPEKVVTFAEWLGGLARYYASNTNTTRFADLPPEELTAIERVLTAKLRELTEDELKLVLRIGMKYSPTLARLYAHLFETSEQPKQPHDQQPAL